MRDFTIKGKKWKGYSDDPLTKDPERLTQPSVNVIITKEGEARTRLGAEATAIDLNQANKRSRPFHVRHFDLTFHAIGTKVYYVNHNNSDAVVDTGITLTDGTESCFEEHNGVVYVTNQTDGCYGFLITRLNGSVSLGASDITTDIEGGAVANVFDTELSVSTKYLRINGTNEQYSAVNASTGVFTLSGTASQDYSDNAIAIVVYNLTARFPKCKKIVAWQECLHFIGLSPDTGNAFSSDRRVTTLGFTQFATAATSENILKISGGTSGTELVGKSGELMNAVATRDYLYLFKQDAVYFIKVSDINRTSGARPPQVLTENYGCINQFSACDIGNGEIIFIAPNKRIVRINISAPHGDALVYPDESFDNPYSNTLPLMSATQTGALVFNASSEKRVFCQLTIDGSKITLPYNTEISDWEPPRSNWFYGGYYERQGILYGTHDSDDTIFKLSSTLDDDGYPIECVMASPILEFDDGRVTCKWKELEISGEMSPNAEITTETIVGRGTPQLKTFDSTGVTFTLAQALGSVTLGSTVLGGGNTDSQMGDWDKRFAIYPSLGSDFQAILSTSGEGQSFGWKSYCVYGRALTKSSLTLK